MDCRIVDYEGSRSGVSMAVSRVMRLFLTVLVIGLVALGYYARHSGIVAHLERVNDYLAQGNEAGARAEIRSFIRSHASEPEVYQHAIRCYVRCGLYEDAIRVGELLLDRQRSGKLRRSLHPHELAELYFALSWSYKETGNITSAEQMGRAALAIVPDSSELLNGLGYLYADEGFKLHEALKLTERAVALAPDDAAIIDSLGWAQYKLGQYNKAVSTLERAVAMAPDQAELRYHLGAALVKLGHKFQARIELTKALLLDPTLLQARQILRTVNN